MTNVWNSHTIAYSESFDLRRPVLEATGSLKDRWRVSSDGKVFEVDTELGGLSPHERAVVEFALNPYFTAANIFDGLDAPVRHALATSLHKFFGVGGPGAR